MTEAGLSAKTITTHTQVGKLVMASAVDADGNQLFPRTWNAEFCDIPVVDKDKQERQTISAPELESVLKSSKYRYAILHAVLAGTGLRIGEALALQTADISSDGRVITVQRGLWRNQLLDRPKTPSGSREVDVPEPLATLLAEYIAGRSGFVFATASGKPLNQRNALRALHAVKKVGFHALRRFRAERLAEAGVPDLLRRWWMGHSAKDISAMYAMGLTQKQSWRREWCDKAGLGFDLGYLGYKNESPIKSEKAA